MASEQAILNAIGHALWNPEPTVSDWHAEQLALALGYPATWRVVRTIEELPPGALDNDAEAAAEQGETKANDVDDEEREKPEGGESNDMDLADGQPPPSQQRQAPLRQYRKCIVDRIYSGEPGSGCDMWYHHHAAMLAAQEWETSPDPFLHKGGHMLPRQALYNKGDRVEVFFAEQWWEAKIVRRKEHSDGYRYQVYYTVDKSKQSNVPEAHIRDQIAAKKPSEIAQQLGLGEGWEAINTGSNRWKITDPQGKVYSSKRTALEAFRGVSSTGQSTNRSSSSSTPTVSVASVGPNDDGDPPWRTEGHTYLGRLVFWSQEHAISARRKVTVEQVGTVVGWISETDVDSAGGPGFVSERTGKPAKLFHIVFEDEPHHPYASHLVQSQDLEEFEVEEALLPERHPSKRSRKG